jgi:SAM-dependent methyltransferase
MNTATSLRTAEPEAPIVRRSDELEVIRRYLCAPGITIVEAGCGRHWPKELANPTAALIGVDTDTAALDLRTDLSKTYVGDVRTVDLPRGQADVVYSSYVLEHVQGAERALANFVDWLKPGGILVVRIPDRWSVYGFLTRTTPHWFHVAYKKYVDRSPHAGEPGFGPYPTYHEPIISREGIRAFCKAHGCEVLHDLRRCSYLESGRSRAIKKAVARVVSALSLGALSWRHDNLCMILRKAPAGELR